MVELDFAALLLNFAMVALIVVPTGFAVRRSMLKQTNQEQQSLLEARKAQIEDLTLRVEHLEGMMEAIQRIKSEEIAVEVVRLLKGEANGLV